MEHDEEVDRHIKGRSIICRFVRAVAASRELFSAKVSSLCQRAVIERLERAGLLDDRAFARFWVENRQTFRPRGTRALQRGDGAKGTRQSEISSEALEDSADEEEPAYRLPAESRLDARLDNREFSGA